MERTKPIPKRKLKAVEELSNLARDKKTILIASIKNLPDSQFQEIRKKLRKKAIIKVPTKNTITRVIDSSGKESLNELKPQIKKDVAFLFSDLDSFELASELMNNKSPAKAKAGQEAPEDIEIQEGPTDLVPGPAVSEFGALGIPIAIEGGKIHVKTPKVIAKKGEKISQSAAELMNKLDIKPFSVGFEPIMAFDTEKEKLYLNIKVDKEETLEELKTVFAKALSLAIETGYVCEDTIKFLISKAGSHEKVIEKIAKSQGDLEDNKVVNDKTEDKSKVEPVVKEKEEIKDNVEQNIKEDEALIDKSIGELEANETPSEPKASEDNTQLNKQGEK